MTKGKKTTLIKPIEINVAVVNPFGEYQWVNFVATSFDGNLVYGTNIDGQTTDVAQAKLPTSVLVRLLFGLY